MRSPRASSAARATRGARRSRTRRRRSRRKRRCKAGGRAPPRSAPGRAMHRAASGPNTQCAHAHAQGQARARACAAAFCMYLCATPAPGTQREALRVEDGQTRAGAGWTRDERSRREGEGKAKPAKEAGDRGASQFPSTIERRGAPRRQAPPRDLVARRSTSWRGAWATHGPQPPTPRPRAPRAGTPRARGPCGVHQPPLRTLALTSD